MNIAVWLEAAGRLHPAAPALLTGARLDADYAGFARRASALARWLRETQGIVPGARVALFMGNSTRYLEALYAIWWAGAVAVPINAKLHAREAAYIVDHAEAKLIFADAAHAATLDEAQDAFAADLKRLRVDDAAFERARDGVGEPLPLPRAAKDLAWLFYTSGTTGKPKGVMLTHGAIAAMSLCYPLDVDTPEQADAALYAAPMSHGAGMYNFVHVRVAARHVIPQSGGFDGDEILDLAKTLRNVSMFAAPTMVRRLVEAARARGENGDGIKTIVYGGGPMYLADIEEAMAVMGPRFVQIYGQGESPMTITALSRHWHKDKAHPNHRARLASVGVAQSAVEVRVTGADGLPLPADEPGEIEVKGATVMAGYWRNPDATAETIRDGWLRTGDVGRLDADGFLTLSDRSKDVIISGGTNIYPREVEEALLTHPAIAEVSVVGAPDAEWGEIVVACVTLKPGARLDEAALDAHCLARIARFKRPKLYLDLADLPKNNYGKVLKTELRTIVAQARETSGQKS